jgi:Uma2 family endonuclease
MTEPLLLVEVLSPSSIHTDMNEKVAEYQAVASLHAYAVCSQDIRRIWLYVRTEGQWQEKPTEIFAPDAAVDIASLGLSIPLADIYFGLELPEE